jgi:hypothetical protein
VNYTVRFCEAIQDYIAHVSNSRAGSNYLSQGEGNEQRKERQKRKGKKLP